jgi:hypothetical protein
VVFTTEVWAVDAVMDVARINIVSRNNLANRLNMVATPFIESMEFYPCEIDPIASCRVHLAIDFNSCPHSFGRQLTIFRIDDSAIALIIFHRAISYAQI